MVEDPKITEYSLCQVRIAQFAPFRCDGFKIKEEAETELEYDGSSRKAFSRTRKKEKIEWEMVKPRDHAVLHEAYALCQQGQTFPIIVLAQDKNGEWKVMDRLDDCDIPGKEREIGSFESPKLTIKGTALNWVVENTQFS